MPENHFDLRQAEALLPEIEGQLVAAIECKRVLDETAREQARMIERVAQMGGSRVNLETAVALKQLREQRMEQIREHIQAVQSYGVLIKDLDIGLVDFPTLIGGREAYLCWKLGEDGIRHWHYTDEGFAQRKAVDEKTIQARHRRPAQ